MKKIICVGTFVVRGFLLRAQSKQVKMYLDQIAANADFPAQMKKAISIAKTGLTTISDIRNGEFNLHDLFFRGSSWLNPKIRNWSMVADIIS